MSFHAYWTTTFYVKWKDGYNGWKNNEVLQPDLSHNPLKKAFTTTSWI